MLKSAWLKSALLVLTLAGCPASLLVNKDKTGFDPAHPTYPPPLFGDYVAHIAKEQRSYPISKIPRSLQIEAPIKLEDGGVGNNFTLSKLDASKICILTSTAGEPHEKTAQQIADANLDLYGKQDSFSFRAISSLAAEKDRALFPVPDGATRLDAAEVISDEIRDVDNRARGTVDRVRVVITQLCAPRPALTDATTFIAITYHLPAAGKPEYESILDGNDKRDPHLEEMNEIERLKADQLILVAITDGSVDLDK